MIYTPRTDTVLVAWDLTPEPKVLTEHARQLERELNAANHHIKRLEATRDLLLDNVLKLKASREIQTVRCDSKRLHQKQEHLSYNQTAQLLGVCRETIRRYQKAGRLTPIRLSSKTVRFSISEIERLLAESEYQSQPKAKEAKP